MHSSLSRVMVLVIQSHKEIHSDCVLQHARLKQRHENRIIVVFVDELGTYGLDNCC